MRASLACAVLAAIAFVSGRAVNAASWSASGFSQSVIMGIGFSDENNGFIAGGQNNVGANILRTTDGAKTFESVPILGPTMMLLGCASMGPDSAVATGLGLLQGGGQFLHNGAFNTSIEPGVTMQSGQDASIIGDGEGYAQAFCGATSSTNSTDQVNGLLVSYDNGASYTLSIIPGNGTANPVRYSAVPSKSVAFVTSGTWPPNTSKKYGKFLTRNIHLHHQKHKMLMHFEKKADLTVSDDGWVAGIFRSNDGFESWTQVFSNETFYFNEIACPSEKICIAAGENDSFGIAYRTTDGGETWEEVLTAPGVSLVAAAAISEDEFFVGGGILGQTGIEGHVYHTTDGGATFELETISGYYLTSLSMVSSTRGFATAMDMYQQSDVLVYA